MDGRRHALVKVAVAEAVAGLLCHFGTQALRHSGTKKIPKARALGISCGIYGVLRKLILRVGFGRDLVGFWVVSAYHHVSGLVEIGV